MPALELVFVSLVTIIGVTTYHILKTQRKVNSAFISEYILFILYLCSILIFGVAILVYDAQYYEAVDPLEGNYSPFAEKHIVTLITFLTLSFISSYLVWIKGKRLPPLLLVICLALIIIGAALCIPIILQASSRTSLDYYINDNPEIAFILAPVINVWISIFLIIKIIKEEMDDSVHRTYKNVILNLFNSILAKSKWQSIWVVLLLVPVFFIVTIILLLFGQEHDALLKVFTETTTWRFSQHTHPPYLDHKGHYLCTVAACGNPRIVKPVRLGNRHGNTIIINRQLMIANAYEEMIQMHFRQFHKFVRYVYDKYGYSFSKHINTPFRSNVIYFLMKPLEWFFLINIYLCCIEPEVKINNQYRV